jgi:hypothetical protein
MYFVAALPQDFPLHPLVPVASPVSPLDTSRRVFCQALPRAKRSLTRHRNKSWDLTPRAPAASALVLLLRPRHRWLCSLARPNDDADKSTDLNLFCCLLRLPSTCQGTLVRNLTVVSGPLSTSKVDSWSATWVKIRYARSRPGNQIRGGSEQTATIVSSKHGMPLKNNQPLLCNYVAATQSRNSWARLSPHILCFQLLGFEVPILSLAVCSFCRSSALRHEQLSANSQLRHLKASSMATPSGFLSPFHHCRSFER